MKGINITFEDTSGRKARATSHRAAVEIGQNGSKLLYSRTLAHHESSYADQTFSTSFFTYCCCFDGGVQHRNRRLQQTLRNWSKGQHKGGARSTTSARERTSRTSAWHRISPCPEEAPGATASTHTLQCCSSLSPECDMQQRMIPATNGYSWRCPPPAELYSCRPYKGTSTCFRVPPSPHLGVCNTASGLHEVHWYFSDHHRAPLGHLKQSTLLLSAMRRGIRALSGSIFTTYTRRCSSVRKSMCEF